MASSAFKARFQDKYFIVPKGGMLKVTEHHKISKSNISESKCFSYQSEIGSRLVYQSDSLSPIKKTKSLSSIPTEFSEYCEVSSVPYPKKSYRNLNRIKLVPIVQDLSQSNSKSQFGSYFNPRRKSDPLSVKLDVNESPLKGFVRRKLNYSAFQSAKLENLKIIKP